MPPTAVLYLAQVLALSTLRQMCCALNMYAPAGIPCSAVCSSSSDQAWPSTCEPKWKQPAGFLQGPLSCTCCLSLCEVVEVVENIGLLLAALTLWKVRAASALQKAELDLRAYSKEGAVGAPVHE